MQFTGTLHRRCFTILKVWSLEQPQWTCKIDEGSAGLIDICWSPDSRHILTTADFHVRNNCCVVYTGYTLPWFYSLRRWESEKTGSGLWLLRVFMLNVTNKAKYRVSQKLTPMVFCHYFHKRLKILGQNLLTILPSHIHVLSNFCLEI